MTGRSYPLLALIKGWCLRNILLKLISLLLGFFLWFHAVTDQSHQIEYPVPLDLSLSDTSLVIVNEIPSDVDVLFAGTGKELLKLWWKHPEFIKKIEDRKAGVKDLVLDISSLSLPAGLNLIPLGIRSPSTLHVVLDEQIEKRVQVLPRLKVIPAEAYVLVGDRGLGPRAVLLKGARGELADVSVIRTIDSTVEGVTDSFTTILPLDLSGMRTVASDISAVKLTGHVEKFVEFELGEIPITLRGRLRDKFTLKPHDIELVVVGPVSLIQNLQRDSLHVYIEINDPPIGETYYAPTIELPEGIDLISEQPKLFKVVPLEDADSDPPDSMTHSFFLPSERS